MVFKSREVAKMVIEEADKQFSPIWESDENSLPGLYQCCDWLDSLNEMFDSESIEVEVDEITMDVSVTIECNKVDVENCIFRKLIKCAKTYAFFKTTEDKIEIKFVFHSVWKKRRCMID